MTWRRAGDLCVAGEASQEGELLEVDRHGQATVLDSTLVPASLGAGGVSVAPDGKRVALVQANTQGTDVYVKQLPNGPVTRLTFGGHASRPSWSPDGRDVLYVSRGAQQNVLMRRPADGSGTESEVVHESRSIAEGSLSPDGAWLLWRTDNQQAGRGDILARHTSGGTTTIPLAATQFAEEGPAVSPDGRWLAYSSDQDGRREVFVRPLSATDRARWQVSTGGGASPQWSHDGRELFFLGPRGMMVARVETKPVFRRLGVQQLFATPSSYVIWDPTHAMDAVTPNADFLIMSRRTAPADTSARPQLTLIEHWLSEIRPLLKR